MMPKKTNYPPLSKKTKRIWIALLAFIIIGAVVQGKIEDYRFNKHYEEASPQEEIETSTDFEEDASSVDEDFETWFNEIVIPWDETTKTADQYLMRVLDGDKNAAGPFLDEIKKARKVADEIRNHPVPTDETYRIVNADLNKSTLIITAMMTTYKDYNAGKPESVLEDDLLDGAVIFVFLQEAKGRMNNFKFDN